MAGAGFNTAQSRAQAARAVDVATQYFAYVAVTGAAAAIAVVTLAYSAQTAMSLVDVTVFPERPAKIERVNTLPAQPDKLESSPNTFAMLPSSMPMSMKNDVISSNYQN
jgi:hypothetical protein